jgi:hypothetical protein
MKKTLWIIGTLFALYFIARAISWPFSVDPSDPSTYASDWGGPTLFGAALVHCGPGVLAALAIIGGIVRGRVRASRANQNASVSGSGRTQP